MTLQGRYEQSHWMVKVSQWVGCMLLMTIAAMGCMVLFPQPLSVNNLKWIQFLQTTAIFLLPPLCMAYLWSKQPMRWLHLSQGAPQPSTSQSDTNSAKLISYTILYPILLMLVALPAVNLLGYLNEQMTLPAFLAPLEEWMKMSEENAAEMTEQFLKVDTLGGLIINILLMALLPAVAEELTFRGMLQRLFDRQSPHVAIWCSAILFSAIHMQFYGFFPRMLMGALFGYMLVWTGTLWAPILMHFTNNAMAVLLYFVAYRAGWNIDEMDSFGTGDTLWLGITSLVLTGLSIYFFRRSLWRHTT